MAEKDQNNKAILDAHTNYMNESDSAFQRRKVMNRQNFDSYHGNVDFSHKLKGQSQEHLPRMAMAIEQTAMFLHQGLLDFGDWFSANPNPGVDHSKQLFTANEVKDILRWQLKKAGFYNHTLDGIKSGLLAALMISKVSGKMVPKRSFKVLKGKLHRSKDKVWQLKLETIRQRNMYLDPSKKGLYKIEVAYLDAWELANMAKDNPDMFDKEALNRVIKTGASGAGGGAGGNDEYEEDKDRELNQDTPSSGFRRKIRVSVLVGHVLHPTSGKLLYENKVSWVADGKEIIVRPRPSGFWDQTDGYVITPLIRVPNSQNHKALADEPTRLNKTLDEIFNLLIDSGISAVHGVKQIREYLLEDPSEIDDGIVPGTTVGITAATPPGLKVIERIDSGSTNAGEGLNAFNLASGEHNSAALSNDLRTGTLPPRAVKATEVVAAENAISSVFTGVSKSVENGHVEVELDKSWVLCLQNIKEMDMLELESIVGEEKIKRIKKMSNEDIFAASYGGHFFQVFGITNTLNKIKDYRKLTTMLQAIGTNPQLLEAFVKKYDFTKLLGELIKALDINEDRIKHTQIDAAMNELDEKMRAGVNPMNAQDTSQTQLPQAGAQGSFEAEPGQLPGSSVSGAEGGGLSFG